MSVEPFKDWTGRRSESTDTISDRLVKSFSAIFEPYLSAANGDDAPAGIHWCLSPAAIPMSGLGRDGHPKLELASANSTNFRRMWAGGSVETLDTLKIGDEVWRMTTVSDVTHKVGRSGDLWFVAVDHEYWTDRGLALRERHDIVYRDPLQTAANSIRPAQTNMERTASLAVTVETSSVMLFRYSALTFNGHRIHYDYPYATSVEGYEGLVVHGPLQATLMLNIAAKSKGLVPRKFDYRGVQPAIAGRQLTVCWNEADASCWTLGGEGQVHMLASTKWDLKTA